MTKNEEKFPAICYDLPVRTDFKDIAMKSMIEKIDKYQFAFGQLRRSLSMLNDLGIPLELVKSILSDENNVKPAAMNDHEDYLTEKSKTEQQTIARIEKVVECLKSQGGINISAKTIGKFLEMGTFEIRSWMRKRMCHSDCPWQNGENHWYFSLKMEGLES